MVKILIADDSELILTILEQALKKWGHEVFKARDGYSVLPEFSRCKPDLVVLDYNMPASSGTVVYERLRAFAGGETVPVIFLSSTSRFELEMMIPLSARVRLRDKPVDLEGLRVDINEMLTAAGIPLPQAWESWPGTPPTP